MPKLIVSDNAKTVKNAQKRLVSLFDLAEICNHFSKLQIRGKFILAKAPWWGGFYERLVGSVKSAIKKCIGNAKLTYNELHTIIIRIEAIMNSRPLTYIDSETINEPLTRGSYHQQLCSSLLLQ